MPKVGDKLPRVEVLSRAHLRKWLKKNHKQVSAIWLVTYKKTEPSYLPYAEVVEELICFGWVDSLPRKLDSKRSMLLIAPRRAGSVWSKLNKDRAKRLILEGLMTKAGLRKITEAKANGTWTKLDAVEKLQVPPDLAAAFRLQKRSAKNFDAFPRSVKRGILEWITQAKKPETRAKRVSDTARLAARNVRANQWRK